jgi:hypothetical protein
MTATATRHRRRSWSWSKASTSHANDDTEARIRADISAATEQLLEEVRAGRSARLVQVLQFASRFHQYSPLNQSAIWCQCPSATHVAGYRTWERMGYHGARGSRGIRILAPRPYTKEKDDGEIEARIAFKLVPVFDASQLNPEDVAKKPLPEFFTDLGSDEKSGALYTRMCPLMRGSGITVEERDDFTGSTQGWSAGGHVAIRAGLSSRNRVRTLTHEWAHELLHQQQADATLAAARTAGKTVKECHAEATSFVVLAHFGIHNDLSSDYLQMWGASADLLAAELAMVQRAASHIITALEAKETEESETSDETHEQGRKGRDCSCVGRCQFGGPLDLCPATVTAGDWSPSA